MEPQKYIENQILGADRLELVRLLYRGAIGAIQDARHQLSAGEIMLRSKSVSKAIDFLSELSLSLNHEVGGDLSKNLAELYGYIQQLVLSAHAEQSDAKLAEAINLLTILLEAWIPAASTPKQPDAPVPVVAQDPAPGPYDFVPSAAAPARSWQF